MSSELNKKNIFARVARKEMSVEEAIAHLGATSGKKRVFGKKALTLTSRRRSASRGYGYEDDYLKDHTVFGERVVLGVTYAAIMLDVARRRFADGRFVGLKNLLFETPLVLQAGESARIDTSIQDDRFVVSYRKDGVDERIKTASGQLLDEGGGGSGQQRRRVDVMRFIDHAEKVVEGADIYQRMRETAVAYGPSLHTIERVYHRDGDVLGELRLSPQARVLGDFTVHPAFLDGAILCAVFELLMQRKTPCIPMFVQHLAVVRPVTDSCYCHCRIKTHNEEVIVIDAELVDGDGQVVAVMEGVTLKKVRAEANPFTGKVAREFAPPPRVPAVETVAPLVRARPGNGGEADLARQLERLLGERIAALLGTDARSIEPTRNFMQMGLESLHLVSLTTTLGDELGVELFPTLFFEHQNIKALAVHLAERHAMALQQVFGTNQDRAVVREVRQSSVATRVARAPAVRADRTAAEPIAIVGMAGVFPRSRDLQEFWSHLEQNADLVGEIPDDRPYLRIDGHGRFQGSFIADVDRFDAAFFGISPREAALMDPKQRIFLELVWKVIEDAGHRASALRGSNTGLFVGIGALEYGHFMSADSGAVEAYSATGIASTILPNRISYLMDWHGPSEAVDTACSSSLVAIHRAIDSIRNGDCDQALAGGINLILSPFLNIAFDKAGMLGSSGRCKTFDQSADGYVRGEGGGGVLLKPLSRAVADGDHIYAVIRGSAVNHGGQASSLTAPNPRAQEELLVRVYNQAEIDPASVSYIEAHGTGTRLGDPVEVKALSNAFRALGVGHDAEHGAPSCGLSSVKTNIGHLEAAAGIAGVIKVLLALQAKRLPGTVHFTKLNDFIELERSPLFVVRETMEWERRGADVPRRAGVSSFGFGGVNAHVVLEEYEAHDDGGQHHDDGPLVFVLSASTPDALNRYATELRAYFERTLAGLDAQASDTHARAVCHTLQIGRDPMAHRLAVVARSAAQLLHKLAEFGAGRETEGTYLGQNSAAPRELLEVLEGEDGRDLVATLIRNRRADKVARLWVHGLSIDWTQLHRRNPPRRVSLPTYPFARERHWNDALLAGHGPRIGALHPLLDRVLPALDGTLRYTKQLAAGEVFVRDHVVDEQPLLPGVCYLEMAYRAFVAAAGEGEAVSLAEVVFRKPLFVHTSCKVRIDVEQTAAGYSFAISSSQMGEREVHATGVYRQEPGPAASQSLDVDSVRQRCPLEMDGSAIYSQLDDLGLRYGSYFRCLQRLVANESEALGWLELASMHLADAGSYALHPALLDGALHVVLGYRLATGRGSGGVAMPFSIEAVEVLAELSSRVAVYIKNQGEEEYDIALLNEDGEVAVKVYGLVARERADMGTGLLHAPYFETLTLTQAEGLRRLRRGAVVVYTEGAEDVCDQLVAQFRDRYDTMEILAAEAAIGGGIEAVLDRGILVDSVLFVTGSRRRGDDSWPVGGDELGDSRELGALFEMSKALDQRGLFDEGIEVFVFTSGALKTSPDESVWPATAGLAGFVRSLQEEYADSRFKVVDLDAVAPVACLQADSLAAFLYGDGHGLPYEIAVRDGRLLQRSVAAIRAAGGHSRPVYRNKGVYLIVGGGGGIGLELARYLARTHQARIALVGRSRAGDAIASAIADIAQAGGEAVYWQADVGEADAIRRVVVDARERLGTIRGVFHSALVLHDALLKNMSRDEFDRVLHPKVAGSVALVEALAGQRLDFLVFFSSAVGLAGAAGQSNYAAASCFQDAFAVHVAESSGYPVKVIDWGYWGTVGVVSTPEYNRRLARAGFESIAPEEGFAALATALRSPLARVVAIKGDRRVHQRIAGRAEMRVVVRGDQDESLAESVRSEVGAHVGSLPADEGRAVAEAFDRFEAYARVRLHQRLQATPVDASEVVPKYERLYHECAAIVERAQLEEYLPEELRADLLALRPDLRAYVELVDTCVGALPDLLRGKKSEMEVMFPGGSLELVEGVYAASSHSDLLNSITAQAVRAHVVGRLRDSRERKITILEVGAGTGATSAFVLALLAPYAEHVNYIYSDVSRRFLDHARARFDGEYPFITYRIMDLEKPSSLQGVDVIFGSNVVHATADVEATLRRLKGMLRRNGCLILNETMARKDFASLSFGITSGWWLYRDAESRIPGSPVVARETWARLLARNGYRGLTFFDVPGVDKERAWQSVITCESDGVAVLDQSSVATGREVVAGDSNDAAADTAPAVRARRVASAPLSPPSMHTGDGGGAIGYARRVLAEMLREKPERIAEDSTFDVYGVDSLISLEIRRRFEQDLGKLPSTLLFDHNTVRSLAEFLDRTKSSELAPLVKESTGQHGVGEASAVASTLSFTRSGAPKKTPETVATPMAGPGGVDIAITGLSGRYPGAESLDELVDNLRAARSCVSEVPPSRWPVADGHHGGRWGSFLDDVDCFDPLFFNISPAEAEEMDPQERIMLELALHALEDAGYIRSTLARRPHKAGVFLGMMNADYEWLSAEATAQGTKNNATSRFWSIPNRISYWFNFRGPSLAIDSACSSSLTAIHLAVQSLMNGECELAVAGGINLILHPEHLRRLDRASLLTPDGVTRSFADKADGFVDGEGAGLVVLKPLARAIADGDAIYGVIKGTGINAGGKTSGYLVPNSSAQADLIAEVLDRSSISPRTISYIESAAAGSSLGDAIEISGLTQAFRRHTDDIEFCAIGSIKSNMGHLESASGIAGLTKVLLQMRAGELFPSLHSDDLNPEIDFASSPFRVQKVLAPWRPSTHEDSAVDGPLRAAVSSFGAGGANAHIIVEAYRAPRRTALAPHTVLVPLSAKNQTALRAYAERLGQYLATHGDALSNGDLSGRLLDIAYTLQTGRDALDERVAFVISSVNELRDAIARFLDGTREGAAIRVGRADAASLAAWPEARRMGHEDDLIAMAEHWVSGGRVEWSSLYQGATPVRVPLPGYPFARTRFWIGSREVADGAALRRQPEQSADGPLQGLVADLLEAVCRVLSVSPSDVSADDDMSQYGLDSIRITEFISTINERLQLNLTPAIFYGHGSIAAFAATLLDRHRDTIAAHYTGTLAQARQEAVATADEAVATADEAVAAADEGGAADEVSAARMVPVQAGGDRRVEPIAIIGLGGVFPGSETPQAFWDNLVGGTDLISEVPSSRWDTAVLDNENQGIRYGGFMPGIELFDPEFFGISPVEARLMDPQHRLFLETTWKSFEDAGYSPWDYWGEPVGVFVGVANRDYADLIHDRKPTAHMATGNAHSVLANRVSYLLNFTGPSEPVDTACSSSLVAIYRAVEALQRGDCQVAVAGGVNTLLSPTLYLSFADAGMLSPDGRCKTFDSRADGYVRGEGVGAVVLKPLGQARADGDQIYAVIKGAAINHGGHTASLTAPNPHAQRDLLVTAYERAAVDPDTVGYIEAHGTGTRLGDPIEINGLKDAFQELAQKRGRSLSHDKRCALGTVKSNIGHLETAAGIAGLIKVLLAMKHRTLPPNLHLETLNPYIDLDGTPFHVVTETTPWPRLRDSQGQVQPRRAGISSFGFGGVNAHVVLEEHVEDHVDTVAQVVRDGEESAIVPVSAQTPDVLREYLRRLSADFDTAAAGAEETGRRAEIERAVATIAGRILAIDADAISSDEALQDLGFDRVAMSRLVAGVNERFNSALYVGALAASCTLATVASMVEQGMPAAAGGSKRQPASNEGPSLRDVAYTLQVGRMAMTERVAFVVGSLSELKVKMDAYLAGGPLPDGVYVGTAPQARRTVGPAHRTTADAPMPPNGAASSQDEIARLWVAGGGMDWRRLYHSEPPPRRVPLPTYPFARKRYWYDEISYEPSNETLALGKKSSTGAEPVAEPVAELVVEPVTEPMVEQAAPGNGSSSTLAQTIRGALSSILGTNGHVIAEDIEFKDLGLDSIMTIKLVKLLNKELLLEINPMDVIDNQTVGKLSQLLTNMLSGGTDHA